MALLNIGMGKSPVRPFRDQAPEVSEEYLNRPPGVNYKQFRTMEDPVKILEHMRSLPTGFGSEEFSPMRGQLPNWAPGEFEEWKQAKITHKPTAYGKIKQARFNRRGMAPIGGGYDQLENNALQAIQQYGPSGKPPVVNPWAMKSLLGLGLK